MPKAFFDKCQRTLVSIVVRPCISTLVGIGEFDLLVAKSIEKSVFLLFIELVPRCIEGKIKIFGGAFIQMMSPSVTADIT